MNKNNLAITSFFDPVKRVCLFILPFFCTFAVAQEMITAEAVQDSIDYQMAIFPQEKIHLHTDRTTYVPGEKIWFRAYIVDAYTHQQPTYSQYAYVELIDADNSLIHRVMICGDEYGLFYGNIFLSEVIPEGDYTLRAYTRYLENLGDDYFFKKNIRIENLSDGRKSRAKKENHAFAQNDYDVTFFPEGGNFPEGILCRIAFKALNKRGASVNITGEVVDNKESFVTAVSTVFAGMGSFSFVPQQGQTYFLNCKNDQGQTKRFKLPAASQTLSLGASFQNGLHFIYVRKTSDIPETPLFLLVHCKGDVYYFAPWDHRNEFISFAHKQLPSGVVQVVLLDNKMNAVSERLIYNKNEDQARIELSTDKKIYQRREKVASEIFLTDINGNIRTGNVSIAITDDADIAIDSLNSIISSLLLSSELRGYIESPGYYLQNHTKAEYALDHLMMTHGWKRYAPEEAIKGNHDIPGIGYEITKEITGLVKTNLLGRPVVNGAVTFFSSDGVFEETVTDAAGRFNFYIHPVENTKFFVQAKTQRGSEGVELILNAEQFPQLNYAPVSSSLFSTDTVQDTLMSNFIQKSGQRAHYDDDIRIVHLEEVLVEANRIEKKDEERLKYWYNKFSETTIYREDIEKKAITNVTQLFNYIPGVEIIRGKVIFSRSGYDFDHPNGSPPLVMINGVGLDWSVVEMVSVDNIESIDIYKGTSASVFGMRGINGVISITTRGSGSDTRKYGDQSYNSVSINPLGYQQAVDFYAPQYDTSESKSLGIPDYRSTIYWKPDLIVSDTGKASFEFYTADFPSTYSIVIEGITDDGKIIRKVEMIEVR